MAPFPFSQMRKLWPTEDKWLPAPHSSNCGTEMQPRTCAQKHHVDDAQTGATPGGRDGGH